MTNTEKKQTGEDISLPTEQQGNNVLSVRSMKVYPFYRIRQSSFSFGNHQPPSVVPHLRLCGNWLQAAGFTPEQQVHITVMKDKLIIQPVKEA